MFMAIDFLFALSMWCVCKGGRDFSSSHMIKRAVRLSHKVLHTVLFDSNTIFFTAFIVYTRTHTHTHTHTPGSLSSCQQRSPSGRSTSSQSQCKP